MRNNVALSRSADNIDIYYDDMLISKEEIIKRYAHFLLSSALGAERSVSIALHTGSICFDVVALIAAALACVSLDESDPESLIASLRPGDIVLFRKRRYRWLGLEGSEYIVLERDGRGKSSEITLKIPFDMNKNRIEPYYGNSKLTDGRGIRKKKSNRADFISYLFNIPKIEIPSVANVSCVIVSDRYHFDRLCKSIRIKYGRNKSIGLLDIVTASYFTEAGEEYQYPGNPAKTEPVFKVVRSISVARDLVLSKQGNRTVGLLVLDDRAISKGRSELTDLLGRQSLRFAHVATTIDHGNVKNIIDMQEDVALFACTREFLLHYSLPVQEPNVLTLELDKQVENIINNEVIKEVIDSGVAWEDWRTIREELFFIRKSTWQERKDEFLMSAFSLLNLFSTASFPIARLEEAIKKGSLNTHVSSPALRIQELWQLADKADDMMIYHCAYVADVLERLYENGFLDCPKYHALKRRLEALAGQKVAVVVPKTYFVDILMADEAINRPGVTIITANKFDSSVYYDAVIVVGDFNNKRFNPLRCKASTNIVVLLYDYEKHRFKFKERSEEMFERLLNARLNIPEDEIEAFIDDESEDVEAYIETELDLDEYINSISAFDVRKFTSSNSVSAGNILTAEVWAIGRFATGEHILFSKYYKAVVYDNTNQKVSEASIEDLIEGDQLVFIKRNDYTRNMVDFIYESLLTSNRMSTEVLEATEKAAYWKKVLRNYKDVHGLTYRDVAQRLQALGSSLQEATVRQWLVEDSHVVGPRQLATMRQIAQLTQDENILSDTQGYFDACRFVRRQRRDILDFLGQAIAAKLSGYKPPAGSVYEPVFKSIENLFEILELTDIQLLEEPMTASVNYTNTPIIDWGEIL